MATVFTMSQKKEAVVSLQFPVPLSMRVRLRSVAALEYVDMAPLAKLAIEYVLDLIEAGKVPPVVAKAIDAAREEKARKKAEGGQSA